MSQRWKSMRVPPAGTGKRVTAATVAARTLRQAVSAQNRRFRTVLPTAGINSASVFQPPRGKELKFFDTSINNSPAFAGTGTLSPNGLIIMPQGTTPSAIAGQECTIKSMQWRQSVSLGATLTGDGSVRTVIVYDKSPNGLAPTIFGTPKSDIFNADNINAQQALQNRDRFIVLADILTASVGKAGPGADYQKGYRKLSLPQVYNSSNAGNVASINVGNIIAITWASTGFATAGPTVVLETRFRFEDA